MFIHLLQLRGKQIYRLAQEIGLVRNLLLFLFLIFAVMRFHFFIKDATAVPLVFAVIFLTLLPFSVHLARRDARFLSKIIDSPPLFFALEYVLLLSPFFATFIYSLSWLYALFAIVFLLLGCLFIAFTKSNIRFFSLIYRLPATLPMEWKSGYRRFGLLLLLPYLLAIVFAQFVYVVPIAVLLISLLTTNFYDEGESVTLLRLPELSPKGLINHKIKQHLRWFVLLIAPLLLLFVAHHHALWFVACLLFVLVVLLQIFAIYCKYAFYAPQTNLSFRCGLFNFLALTSLLIPFIFFAVWIGAIFLRRKAIKNLKNYLIS